MREQIAIAQIGNNAIATPIAQCLAHISSVPKDSMPIMRAGILDYALHQIANLPLGNQQNAPISFH